MFDFLGKGVETRKMVSSLFFSKRWLYIPSNRGPFPTSHQYLIAKVNLPVTWINSEVWIAQPENANDIDSDCDEDLVEDAMEMLDVCETALKSVPHLFPTTEKQNAARTSGLQRWKWLYHHSTCPGQVHILHNVVSDSALAYRTSSTQLSRVKIAADNDNF